jgi:hypothetical protein
MIPHPPLPVTGRCPGPPLWRSLFRMSSPARSFLLSLFPYCLSCCVPRQNTLPQPALMRTSPAVRSSRGLRLSMDVSLPTNPKLPLNPLNQWCLCTYQDVSVNHISGLCVCHISSRTLAHGVCVYVCVCVCVSCVYVCVLACVMQTSKVVRNFINSQSLTRGASMTVSHG